MSESESEDSGSEAAAARGRTSGKGSNSDSDGGRGSDEQGQPLDQEANFEDDPDSEQAADAQATIDELTDQDADEAAEELLEEMAEADDEEDTPSAGAGGGGDSDGPAEGAVQGDVDGPEAEPDGTQAGDGTASVEATIGASEEEIAEFARETLSDGAVDPKHRDGAGEITAFPPEEPSHPDRVGGWDEFDEENVVSQQPLPSGGWTSSLMTVARVDTDDGEEQAFVTDYSSQNPFMQDSSRGQFTKVTEEQKHSQMALYAYSEAMGLNGPDFTHDTDRGYVVAQGIDAEGAAVGTDEIRAEPDRFADHAANVDADDLKDQMAAHFLAGNWDVKYDNVVIDSAGTVHVFDYDRMERSWNSRQSVKNRAKQYTGPVVENINKGREEAGVEKIQIDHEDIADRAAELATELKESGHDDVVEEAIRAYDPEFRTSSKADQFRNNVEELAHPD